MVGLYAICRSNIEISQRTFGVLCGIALLQWDAASLWELVGRSELQ